MAYTTGQITTKSRIYDMTGKTNYTPSNGADLGAVSDLILTEFQREVTLYRSLAHGNTPTDAAIDANGVMLQFGLREYDAAVMKVLAQNTRPSANNNNFHGIEGGPNYKLGMLLGSNEILSLLVADADNPGDYPALYIPRAVITRVENLALSKAERSVMAPALFTVIGLFDTTIGDTFAFGDKSDFPSLA